MTHVIVCCDDDRLEQPSDCQNPLHNHPLPAGYVQASIEANRRFNTGWLNKKCPQCHKYGWKKP